MKRVSPYTVSNFETLMTEQMYFVDKTHYIERLEAFRMPVFLRPRRFGKSLFTEMLRWYYDIQKKADFERLFGKLYIGQHPTIRHNTYFFLALDFSGMGTWVDDAGKELEKAFNRQVGIKLASFIRYYADLLGLDHNYWLLFQQIYQEMMLYLNGLQYLNSLLILLSSKTLFNISKMKI